MQRFTWPCDPSLIGAEIEVPAIESEFEHGPDSRRAKGIPRKKWSLRFRKDQIDADEIWSFYVARGGAFEEFLWNNPLDGKDYVVRFEQNALTRSVEWKALFSFGIQLVEVPS